MKSEISKNLERDGFVLLKLKKKHYLGVLLMDVALKLGPKLLKQSQKADWNRYDHIPTVVFI